MKCGIQIPILPFLAYKLFWLICLRMENYCIPSGDATISSTLWRSRYPQWGNYFKCICSSERCTRVCNYSWRIENQVAVLPGFIYSTNEKHLLNIGCYLYKCALFQRLKSTVLDNCHCLNLLCNMEPRRLCRATSRAYRRTERMWLWRLPTWGSRVSGRVVVRLGM